MKRSAVIVAGGKGARMNSELPKQFMLLLDSPILMHTIERFAVAFDDIAIVLVLPSDQIGFWERMCKQVGFDVPHQVVEGGDTRYASVRNGVAVCEGDGVIGIHDGVRPLVSPDLIQLCFNTAAEEGSALPVLPVTQSLRRVTNEGSEVVSRDGVVEVQTPQCFHAERIKACYAEPFDKAFTDDATVYERAGHKVHLVDGEPTNLKITTPGDLQIAEALLSPAKKAKR